ncbi:hypothetical protein CK204_27375, partial [Klebsiella pneumoniae]
GVERRVAISIYVLRIGKTLQRPFHAADLENDNRQRGGMSLDAGCPSGVERRVAISIYVLRIGKTLQRPFHAADLENDNR